MVLMISKVKIFYLPLYRICATAGVKHSYCSISEIRKQLLLHTFYVV